jgi:hypothetical protein
MFSLALAALSFRRLKPGSEFLSTAELGLLLVVAELNLRLAGLFVVHVARIGAFRQLPNVPREHGRGVHVVGAIKHFCAFRDLQRGMAGWKTDRVARLMHGAERLEHDS